MRFLSSFELLKSDEMKNLECKFDKRAIWKQIKSVQFLIFELSFADIQLF